jgi:hypothetical protein
VLRLYEEGHHRPSKPSYPQTTCLNQTTAGPGSHVVPMFALVIAAGAAIAHVLGRAIARAVVK